MTFLSLLLALNAACQLIPAPGFSGKGEVRLSEKEEGMITLEGTFEGFTPNQRHTLQLHAEGCSTLLKKQAAGAHFNPMGVSGCDPSLAILDLGEIKADEQGTAYFEATLENAHLEGADSIVGYSLVIHPAGALSIRSDRAPFACGVIEPTSTP